MEENNVNVVEENNMKDVVEEIKNANEDELRAVVEDWFKSTRTQGMQIGAYYISAGIFGIIQKHLNKKAKASLNDYRRCVDDIIKVISVQLAKDNDNTQQNDSEGEKVDDERTENRDV